MRSLTTGSGSPVTVFAPGRGETIPRTRPFGSGVHGTRVFFEFSGDDSALVTELRTVTDAAGASRGFGVSLGAAAMVGLLAEAPERFERVVLALPALENAPYAAMRRVTCPVLVIGQADDPIHPVSLAHRTAAAFPSADRVILPPGGLLTAHRARLRDLIAGFLNREG